MLKNVRLSFPSIFKRSQFNGEDGKFEATFLLGKKEHAELISKIEKEIEKGIKENLKGAKVASDKRCLKDGDEQDYDGYKGTMSFKAASDKRPLIIDRDKSPLAEDDGKPYAGCYVNAQVSLWYQNNSYGKRVNANLLAIQFFKDGDAFGNGETANEDDFDSFDDDDDFLD